jgi:hypothetical protein
MNYKTLGTIAGLMVLAKPLLSRKPAMPSVPGIIETAHCLPGRVRFVIPSLVNNPGAVETLETKLALLDQVESLHVSPVSGSVVIYFDASAIEPAMLFGATARLLGLDGKINDGKQSVLWREMKAAGRAIDRAIYSKSAGFADLKTLVTLSILGTFAYKLVAESNRLSSPGTVTLGWWVFNLLFMRRAI